MDIVINLDSSSDKLVNDLAKQYENRIQVSRVRSITGAETFQVILEYGPDTLELLTTALAFYREARKLVIDIREDIGKDDE